MRALLSQLNASLGRNHLLILIMGLLLGVDKFYSTFLPFPFLSAVPAVSLFSLLLVLYRPDHFDWKNTVSHSIMFLTLYGLLLALGRFYFKYQDGEYFLLPIFRHAGALLLGLTFFNAFMKVIKEISLQRFAQIIISTSVPFLLIALYQLMIGQKVGHFTRVTSLFSEPSYYGDYLVLLLIPCFLFQTLDIRNVDKKYRNLTYIYGGLLLLNLLAVQSGTAILKCMVVLVLILFFYPINFRFKLIVSIVLPVAFLLYAIIHDTYTYQIGQFVIQMFSDPNIFFQHQTLYDRFFPNYAAVKSLFSLKGLFGLGLGGDYFEFERIYPSQTHYIMRLDKPSLSFFNSYFSKIILFFGVFGVAWLFYLFRKAFQVQTPTLKIAFFSVLISGFWGVSNFALPYIWLWLAFTISERRAITEKKI